MEMRWKQVCSAVHKIDTSVQPKHGDEMEANCAAQFAKFTQVCSQSMEMRWKQVCSAVHKIDTSVQPKHGDEVEASV
eukprot:1152733-Pelagomonas_calceolata.AAC.5